MDMEKSKRVVGEVMDKLATEMQFINQKKSLNSSDVDVIKKMLEAMEKAACIMEMAEQAGEGYSGRGYSNGNRGYSMRSGDGYSSRNNSGENYPGDRIMGRSYADGRSYDDGYSERSRAANGQYRSGENYSGHSVEDRMIADLEEMAGRAGNDQYELQKIQQGIDALRKIFN